MAVSTGTVLKTAVTNTDFLAEAIVEAQENPGATFVKPFTKPVQDWNRAYDRGDLERTCEGIGAALVQGAMLAAPFARAGEVAAATGEAGELVAASGEAAEAAGVVAGASRVPKTGMARTRGLYGRQTRAEFCGSQIKRLKKRMQQRGYDASKPIEIVEVNGRKIIVDGHHRARAAGAAGIREVPVEVIVVNPATASQYLREAADAAVRLGLESRW